MQSVLSITGCPTDAFHLYFYARELMTNSVDFKSFPGLIKANQFSSFLLTVEKSSWDKFSLTSFMYEMLGTQMKSPINSFDGNRRYSNGKVCK